LLAGAIAVLVPLASLAVTRAPVPAPPRPTLRLMTYNVHQGFGLDNASSLDALVETIEREAPDVLVLQEAVRGWMIAQQHDVVGVLSERLAMPYAFAPTIGDVYGNAVLSRMPMTVEARVLFPRAAGLRHQPRGALIVRIADVVIAATHLDEHEDASAVRQDQVRALLRELDGRGPAVVVAGDLNAPPESLELGLLAQSDFADLAVMAGAREGTYPADVPVRRIDYVLGIGVIAAQAHTVASTASDHRAVVVNITRIEGR
ncbi:MAG: endonuclease/exonuclease/phosphatase family protein, partial [Candidatus Limnocylindria bacterium]